MKESNSRREFLSQSGKMVTAAALFGTSVPLAHAAASDTIHCEANNTMKITDPHYYLDNVLLENGFDYENGVAVQTRTARQNFEEMTNTAHVCRQTKRLSFLPRAENESACFLAITHSNGKIQTCPGKNARGTEQAVMPA